MAGRPVLVRPGDWALWTAPSGVLPYYVGVELAAVALTSVWIGGGALLLPPLLAALLTAVIYRHLGLRVSRSITS